MTVQMKSYSFLIFLGIALLFSCNNDNPETTGNSGTPDSIAAGSGEENSDKMQDSAVFHIGNHAFEIAASSLNDFNAVADPFKMIDTSEADRIKNHATFVSRSGDSLMFGYSNNKTAYLINNNSNEDDADTYAVYSFIKDMNQINQWLVIASYNESYGYILIDKTTGDSTMLYGMPVVAPDHRYFITFNQDLQAGFTFNGFQLFEMKNGRPMKLGEKELYTWGPDNVKWKDAHTLLVQQAKSDTNMNMTADYIQMNME